MSSLQSGGTTRRGAAYRIASDVADRLPFLRHSTSRETPLDYYRSRPKGDWIGYLDTHCVFAGIDTHLLSPRHLSTVACSTHHDRWPTLSKGYGMIRHSPYALVVLILSISPAVAEGTFRLDLSPREAAERLDRMLLIDLPIGDWAIADPFAFCRDGETLKIVAGTPTHPRQEVFPSDIIVTRVDSGGVTAAYAPDASPQNRNLIAMAIATAAKCSWLDQTVAAPEYLLDLRGVEGHTSLSDLLEK